MRARTWLPRPLARALVIYAARLVVRDPVLNGLFHRVTRAEDDRQYARLQAEGQAIAAAWPPGAYPDIDTSAWEVSQWAHLGAGIDPEDIEGDRRYLDDQPLPDCLDLDGAAAEAARIIPDSTEPDPDRVRDVAVARVLLAVLLQAAAHDYRDFDAVRVWAADLTPAGLDDVHTAVHGCLCGDVWPALALLTVCQALPNPTRTRISSVITTALHTAAATTAGPRP